MNEKTKCGRRYDREFREQAVVRVRNGRAWVYLQTADGAFTRKEISTDRPIESGWFVQGAIAPGDKLVVTGAQQLLSEELKSQGGGE